MTLTQVEERLTVLEQIVERLTALEKVVEQLQTRTNGDSKRDSSSNGEHSEGAEDDLLPGTEYDLVVTVPPHQSLLFFGRIVRIERPPAELGLSDAEWALFGSEDEDE